MCTLHCGVTKPAWEKGTRQPGHRKPVFISGPPRSGTTWVLEVLESMLGARRHWEPLKGFEQRQFDNGSTPLPGGGYRPEAAQAEDVPGLRDFVAHVLSDGSPEIIQRLRNPALSARENLKVLGTAPVTLVKFTAAQRLLPWIGAEFDTSGIVILRNPLATIASQIKNRPPNYQDNPTELRLSEAALERYPFLAAHHGQALPRDRRLAISACLDFCMPLHDPQKHAHHGYIAYETLVERPEGFRNLLTFLNLTDAVLNDRIDSARPSSTTRAGSNVLSGGDPRLSWQRTIQGGLLKFVRSLMENFRIDCYSEAPEFAPQGASILEGRALLDTSSG